MPKFERTGTKWPNITLAYDHSTEEGYCEIHLRVNFDPNMDVITEATDAIGEARATGDKKLKKLKAILRRELKRAELDEEENLAIVGAIMLPPAKTASDPASGKKKR